MKLRGICDGRPPFCTSLRDIKVPGRNVAMMDGVLSLSQLDPWQPRLHFTQKNVLTNSAGLLPTVTTKPGQTTEHDHN